MGANQSQPGAGNAENEEINFDHFQVMRAIGKGSFGKVCIVKRKSNDQMYAMKYMNKRKCLENEAIQNVIREIQILSVLDHPFIINLKFSFQDEEDMFMITDLMLGGDLRYHLIQGLTFDDSCIKFYLSQLLLALDYLRSKQIVHRDIKPDNILLNELGYLYLSDFNVAAHCSSEYSLNTICGTTTYIAPEVYASNLGLSAGYGHAVDWWSVGAVAVELATGKLPFEIRSGQTLQNILHTIQQFPSLPVGTPSTFVQLLRQLLHNDPKERLTDLDTAKKMEYFEDFDFDQILAKTAPVPFVPPQKSLNCDPSHELEEMIIESHPLHKKKKRLQKQRSQRELLQQSSSSNTDPLQSRLEQVADNFLVFDREKEQKKQRQTILEENWERELAESMEQSQPISEVDRSVLDRIRSDLLTSSVKPLNKSTHSMQSLDVEGLGVSLEERDLSSCHSAFSTPECRKSRRPRLRHQQTIT